MEQNLEAIYQGIVSGDQDGVCDNISMALRAGADPEEIVHAKLIPAMREVGRRFEEGDFFLPEMLIAARAMKSGMKVLEPSLASCEVQPIGRVVIGTVEGDLHDIGKNLVGMMLTGVGFKVVDLGADVKVDRFIAAAADGDVDIVAMSALLSTTMVNMQKVVDGLDRAGLRQQVRVIVGGAPLTEERAREIGADGFSEDASRAATLASSLVSPD